jgi:hypothetical protein
MDPGRPSDPADSPGAAGAPADPDRGLSWRGWLAVAAAVLAAQAAFLHLWLRREPVVTVPGPRFEDRFDRERIGPDWWSAGGHWQLRDGELWSPGARNNPLWLRMRLPRDVAIEFEARSETAAGPRAGDIKLEVFGDGRDHASGYVLIFGGWGNQVSAIARRDEHGADRQERRDRRVEPGRTYHMRVERKGNALRWLVDGEPFLAFEDPAPLEGKGHDRLGFSSWDADLVFDDLRIEPL